MAFSTQEMSEPSSSTELGPTAVRDLGSSAPHYELSDDLSRLCLPQEFQDSCRNLAWVDSICCLFLAIGLVGINPPKVVVKPLSEVVESAPIIVAPVEEQAKPETREVQPDDSEPSRDPSPDSAPQVIPVVAAANDPLVAFGVPVEGVVAIRVDARGAAPPPPVTPPKAKPPTPTMFYLNSPEAGNHPPPAYPPLAWRNQYQGTAVVRIKVDTSGTITSVTLQKSSGYKLLDDAALKVVSTQWTFFPGPMRDFIWECKFELKSL